MGTQIKIKNKRQRQTPLYFKTRKSSRIKEGKPQNPTNTPIIIEESLSKIEELEPIEMKVDKVTSPGAISKTPITYVRNPVTRETSYKSPKAPITLQ